MIRGLDENAHVTALTSLLDGLPWPTFEFGKVPGLDGNPGVTPDCYLLLQVERMPLPILRSSRMSTLTSWWVQVRVVDRRTHNCHLVLAAVSGALENRRITVDGHDSTSLTFDASSTPEPDGGWFSAPVSYTYVL